MRQRPYSNGRSTRVGLPTRRRGTTLLEVMLATVMLLGSVMALSRIAFLARMHAIGAEDRSLSQIHCQNIIEEILAGVRPLQSESLQAFEGDQWVYMVTVEALDQLGLAKVTVTVDRWDGAEEALPSEDEITGYRLVRWVRPGDRTWDSEGTGMGEESGVDDLFEGDMYDEDSADADALFGGEDDSAFEP